MSDAARATATAGTNLVFGQVIAMVVGALGSIALVRLLTQNDYGLFSMVLIPLSLLHLIRDWGMPYAVQQKITKAKGRNVNSEAWKIARRGVLWELSMGLFLAALLVIFSNEISNLLGHSQLLLLIIVSAPIVATWGVYQVVYGIFIGLNESKISVYLLVASSITKVAFSIVLVLCGFGSVGAIGGQSLSSIIFGIISFIIISRKSTIDEDNSDKVGLRVGLIDLLKFSAPLGAISFSANIVGQIIPMVGMNYVTSIEFAIYGVASVLFSFLSIPFQPIVLTLLSSFTKTFDQNYAKLKLAFEQSTIVSSFIFTSISIIAVFASPSLITLLFGLEYTQSANLLILMCMPLLFLTSFGSVTLGPLLMSSGHERGFALVNVFVAILMITLSFIIIPVNGVVGIVQISIITVLLTTLGLSYLANKSLGISTFTRRGVFLSLSVLASLVVGHAIQITLVTINEILGVIVSIFVSLSLLIVLSVRSGIIRFQDAEFLLHAAGDSLPASIVATILLRMVKIIGGEKAYQEVIE